MEKAKLKIILPQEGTRKGESLPERSSGCPTFSGGGRILQDSGKNTTTLAGNRTKDDEIKTSTLALDRRTTDGPTVVLEKDPALDRFAVQHWTSGSSSSPADRKRSLLVDAVVGDEVTPSKVTTARRGKTSGPGTSAGVTRATAVGEASGSAHCPLVEPPCSAEACDEADVEVLEGIEFLDPARLRALAKEKVDEILEVAKKSGNLKGTFIKSLKEAAWTLQEVTSTALTRTVASETLILRRETRKLRQEVEELKAELAGLRSSAAAPPSVPQLQSEAPRREPESLPKSLTDVLADHMVSMERSLRLSMGEVITARIEALEDRLLPAKVIRPPLAADRQAPSGSTVSKPARQKTAGRKPANPLGMEWAPLSSAVNPVPTPASDPVPVLGPDEDGWTTVARRRRRKAKKASVAAPSALVKATASRKKVPGAKPKRRLPSMPRSAAVIITLRPEAVEGGVSYKSALMGVNRDALADLGIENLSLRPAATGSRIIEIPGARGPEQADGLAQRLQEALADVATVVRPVKKANVRIVGLDETVSVAEVISAAAARGGCEPALIRAGEIRPYGRGSGAIHLSLPAVAAKALLEAGRLLVGWSAARVRLLNDGPLRCYRCLDVGHTRPVCQSAIDRGALCFRCGQPGHKALQCAAVKLHCALCADAGRPNGHYMGGAACRPPTSAKTPAQPSAPGPVGGQAQTNR